MIFRKKGFTLIELLIGIGILAVITTSVLLILNPAEIIRRARDAQRINDINALQRSIALQSPSDLDGPNYPNDSCRGQANQRIFVSVPNDNGETPPTPPSGWAYAQVTSDNLRHVDGGGWVPVDFTTKGELGLKSTISSIPVDPINTFASGLYYTYVCGSYEFTAAMESNKYKQSAQNEGGDSPDLFEVGTDFTVTPVRSTSTSSSSVPTCSTFPSTVNTGENTAATGSGGDGSYAWSAPGGSPSSGNGTVFSTYYGTSGVKTITVTSASQNGNCNVTVNSSPGPAPTITSINPSSGTNNGVVSISSVSGNNFQSGAAVKLTKTGQSDILGSGFAFANSTTINGGSFNLTGAATGTWNVIVTNPDSQSGTLANGFAVNQSLQPAPSVSSISPNTGTNDGTVGITSITGSNFQSGATVKLTKTGQADIIGSGFAVISGSTINGGSFNINGALTGAWNVVVVNPDIQSGSLNNGFTIETPALSVLSVTPSSRGQGASGQSITVNGQNFQSGASATVSGTGITVNNTAFISGSELSLNVTISGSAATGARDVTVVNPDSKQGICSGCFTVNVRPAATSVNPTSTQQGTLGFNIVLNGSGFQNGAGVSVSGTGVTVSSTTFNSPSQITATINVGGSAAT
ncbi:MAG: type II secretion system protein, partial [Patescibacteria group bacterium]